MHTVLETLYLRKPRLEYVSPAVCEVLFSSSGQPIIMLDPIAKVRTPTGPVWGGGTRLRFFNWPNYPGVLCFSVYQAVDPNNPDSPYNLISECVGPDVIAVCLAGSYQISVNTSQGEGALSSPVVCPGSVYSLIPLPQFPGTISFNLYKDGVKIWANFVGGAFQICSQGCFKIGALTVDGESSLSDPICTQPCADCPVGQTLNPDTCECTGACVEIPCSPGFHWDAGLCECVADTPPGACSSPYVDQIASDYTIMDMAQSTGTVLLRDPSGVAYLYKNRILAAQAVPGQPNNSYYVNAIGDQVGTESDGLREAFYYTFEGVFSEFGPQYPHWWGPTKVSDNGCAAIKDNTAFGLAVIFKKGSGVVATLGNGLDDIGIDTRSMGPQGHFIWGQWAGTDLNLHLWNPTGGDTDLSFPTQGFGVPSISSNGRFALMVKLSGGAGPWSGIYWDGSSIATFESSTVTHCGVNSTGVVIWSSGTHVHKWTALAGDTDLGAPDGNTVTNVWITNDDLMIAATSGTGRYYYTGSQWRNIIECVPVGPVTGITNIYEVSYDNYFTGIGYTGTYYAVTGKFCKPV